ncbi:unnamed protein product [Protopolystoma xenopodis]|uniref:Uncharacterized protein n=1 Tax=Protopolystoma xenopodis TaxID=117903 RepID=A0A3S5B1B5_9PLAT|nr:unnamed protein product [Protopolystoma xenopodis]
MQQADWLQARPNHMLPGRWSIATGQMCFPTPSRWHGDPLAPFSRDQLGLLPTMQYEERCAIRSHHLAHGDRRGCGCGDTRSGWFTFWASVRVCVFC